MAKSKLLAVMAVGKLLGYSVSATVNPFSGSKYWTAYVWKEGDTAPKVLAYKNTTKAQAIKHGWVWIGSYRLGERDEQ